MDMTEEEKRKARIAALAQLGVGMGGSGSGVLPSAIGMAGAGASLGTAIGGPGAGTLIGAGSGALVGAIGSGIEGAKSDKLAKENAAREDRKINLIEQEQKNSQFNTERSAGLEGLKFLAQSRSNAIQSRNRSLFKNDLMRIVGGK